MNDSTAFLATMQPDRGQRRIALAVFAVSLAFFLAAVPFAKVQLAPVTAFIPVYQSALVVSDLITAILLYGQFRILRSRGLAILASGYLFTAFIAIAHALTFPGLFAPSGLLGAGPQSTAWLYMFWHVGFPLFVIAYALAKDQPGARSSGTGMTVGAGVGAAFLLVAAAVLLATKGQALLPAIMVGNRYSPSMIVVVSSTWAFSLLALFILWRHRPRSVIDLWLMVVMCAWLFDIALSAVLNQGRFDLGFYAGRIYGLLAATFVLMMLLLENSVLYARLVESNARARERSAELERLGQELEAANGMLAEKNLQLQKADRLKSDFLANMSHELRTPLNAIIGFSEVMKDGLTGELPPQQKEYVTDIYSSGKHLLALINEILDLSKIEAGKMTLERECCQVGELVRDGLQVVRERATAQRLDLSSEVEDGLDDIWLDVRKTRQILYNLLSNAVKFTPEGGSVRVVARKVGRERFPGGSYSHYLELAVSDSGIGISAEDQARLFQPFLQIDSELSRRYEGTGLGLTLLKRLAELQGGGVGLQSEPGKGSTFTVWLPWHRPADATAAALSGMLAPALASGPNPAPLALVIEDDEMAANLLRVQLEDGGFRIIRTTTAEIGMEAALREQPDVIILDILLPGMDGWEMLERIKREPQLTATPVVIVSIMANCNRGLALGAAGVLQKPVSRSDLIQALEAIGFQPTVDKTPRTVLVVDDDRKAVELVRAHLEAASCRVLPAYGGQEGIELAREHRPDLIVLDLMMPAMNGFDVVEALKDDPVTRSIPVVIVTAKQIVAEDRLRLIGRVQEIMQKAEFNHGRFIGEVRRALPGKGR
ncbi:MAG TPA: response regulator [Noviherbaspirillum sp.]|uniref:response regulator n=1 Tax=Noviherbaspirillum sp. TaxID=1926288 RepID=UPI002D4014FC|nr:response regulator [Noviherbaspirillum sp.]HYD96863.1 response regulator [Noviherbaspirillum sp.]